MSVCVFLRKIRTRLDLLSIPQSEGNFFKTFRWDHRRVFFPFILDIKFVGHTSRGHTGGRSHRIFHPPSFCGACLNFSREKDSAIPFTRRPCVCVFSSHPFWTSSSLDVPAGVTQEEGHTGFLIHLPSAVRALIFVARRIRPFLSLVDREVEFCVLTN